VRGDGSGGDSIYGGKFNDEKTGLKYKHPGKRLSTVLANLAVRVVSYTAVRRFFTFWPKGNKTYKSMFGSSSATSL
jgi:hypothetical protein